MNGKETLGNISLGGALLGGSETEALTSRTDRKPWGIIGLRWEGGSRTEAWTSQTDRLRRAPLGGSEGAIY